MTQSLFGISRAQPSMSQGRNLLVFGVLHSSKLLKWWYNKEVNSNFNPTLERIIEQYVVKYGWAHGSNIINHLD